MSASYYYSTDAKDDYTYAEAGRLWLDSGKKEAIGKSVVSRVNSDRHTLGLYYRGRSGVWNYTYDLITSMMGGPVTRITGRIPVTHPITISVTTWTTFGLKAK